MTIDWNHPTLVKVCDRYVQLNRRAVPEDAAAKPIYEVAVYYASNYEGTFGFMNQMRDAFDRWNRLTPGQVAGVINCLVREYKQRTTVGKVALAELPTIVDQKPTRATERPITAECAWCKSKQPCVTTESLEFVCIDRAACRIRQRETTALPVQNPEMRAAANLSPVESSVAPVCKNGTYTVVLNEKGDYRTIKLSDAPESYGKPKGTQIAGYLSGSDNESDYRGFAFVTGDKFGIWKAFKPDSQLAVALRILLTADRNAQLTMGESYAIESGNCFVCGRRLTVPASLHRGMGPICAEKY